MLTTERPPTTYYFTTNHLLDAKWHASQILTHFYRPELCLHSADKYYICSTKALLARAQRYTHPSLSLGQASLLLVTYEYGNGRPEVALVSIAGCALRITTQDIILLPMSPIWMLRKLHTLGCVIVVSER